MDFSFFIHVFFFNDYIFHAFPGFWSFDANNLFSNDFGAILRLRCFSSPLDFRHQWN